MYVRTLLGNDDDAADVRQDVYSRLLIAMREGSVDRRNLRGWLFRAARNRAFDLIRRRRFASLLIDDTAVSATPALDRQEGGLLTWDAVDRLPRLWREAIVLRYRWRFETGEIAALQNKTDGAVRAEISRALRRLAIDLEEAK